MKLITAVIQSARVNAVRAAMEEAGVHGLTLTQAMGVGRQRGHTEVYRGAEVTVNLIPKSRLEVLVDDADAAHVTEVMVAAARTGTIGDGKVWVLPVEEVVRVRTGERGSAAL